MKNEIDHKLIWVAYLTLLCIHGAGCGLMHKKMMMKMMMDKHHEHNKGITIGFKAVKIPIPIPVAMPVMETKMKMKAEKPWKSKDKMMDMMKMHMKMKLWKMKMKMDMKMNMKAMKAMKMSKPKCKPCLTIMKGMKCDTPCPEASCPAMMATSCGMKGCQMMNGGWPAPAMMDNGWPAPAMMKGGWPSPMMKGMCPTCPPCDMEENPEDMEYDYYEDEVMEDQNAWDTSPIPVYAKTDDIGKRRGDDFDDIFRDNHWKTIKWSSNNKHQHPKKVNNFDIDFEY